MMTQEIVLELFLLVPSPTTLSVIDDKELALTLLKKLPDSASKCYVLFLNGDTEFTRISIIMMAVRENNYCIFHSLLEPVIEGLDNTIKVSILLHCTNNMDFFSYILKYINIDRYTYKKLLHIAAKTRNMELYNMIVNTNQLKTVIRDIANDAAEYGNREILNDLIRRGANSWIDLACSAARGDHIEIMNNMIKNIKGDKQYRTIAYHAAQSGNISVVYDMINKSDSVNWLLITNGAAKGGNLPLFLDMLSKCNPTTNDYVMMAVEAAKKGHSNIVDYLATNMLTVEHHLHIACAAAEGGHRELLNKYFVDDLNEIATSAAEGKSYDIVREMIELGADNYFEILEYSDSNLPTVKLLLSKEDDIEAFVDYIEDSDDAEVIALAKQYRIKEIQREFCIM